MKHHARKLRKNMTDAERLLWRHLRNRQLGEYKFRRQRPIGPYIVDFVCLEKKLVIEVDGGQHAGQVESDAKRSGYLEDKGYKVLRFWNNEVLKETESVLTVVLSTLDGTSPLTPALSPRGEGEYAQAFANQGERENRRRSSPNQIERENECGAEKYRSELKWQRDLKDKKRSSD
ncbi:MAG: endonuclease domain-containing protein [Deltaproteobacteria bacterium]|nr:endonuclease domain-containing protein [Deltaproteobacteria bacterium]